MNRPPGFTFCEIKRWQNLAVIAPICFNASLTEDDFFTEKIDFHAL